LPIAWTELGPHGLLARVVTADPGCPTLTIDGREQAMRSRAKPSAPSFPVLVCEAEIPQESASAAIGGQALALIEPGPQRIVFVGDTGCRVEGYRVQACNDPSAWPFARIAERIAALKPSLVVHLGDYIYRETPCPLGRDECRGPSGEGWEVLAADFFEPARPLLASAPWLFLRGNHEICARGGEAWLRFLDPRPMPARCQDYTEPYKVSVGGLGLIALDAAIANDFAASPEQVAAFASQFDAVRRLATGESWLVGHKPLYVFGHRSSLGGIEQLFMGQEVLQQASGNELPASVRLLVGGHVHLFEALSFGAARPPQLVVGNSGTMLDEPVTTSLAGLDIAGMKVAAGWTQAEFGFVLMEPEGGGWRATFRSVAGEIRRDCRLEGRTLDCGP
jgi:hypothetical protein